MVATGLMEDVCSPPYSAKCIAQSAASTQESFFTGNTRSSRKAPANNIRQYYTCNEGPDPLNRGFCRCNSHYFMKNMSGIGIKASSFHVVGRCWIASFTGNFANATLDFFKMSFSHAVSPCGGINAFRMTYSAYVEQIFNRSG